MYTIKYQKILSLTILLSLFLTPVLGAEQILKPTADTGGAINTPGDAYDIQGYDDSTAAVAFEPDKGVVTTFNSWDTTNKKSYVGLNLSVTVVSSGFTDDTWALYYDATADTACESAAPNTDTALKPSGSENVNLRNYTASLPTSQNLGNIQVCVAGNQQQGPEKGRSVSIYDIRTEGQYDGTQPEWRAQQQNNSIISKGDSVKLSAQAKDNVQLDYGILSTNETGSWSNKSVYGSPLQIGTSNTWTWSNFTWQNGSLGSSTVSWKVWYNDSSGNYNVTDVKTFEIDAVKPGLTIHKPVNQIYSSNSVNLNVSADEQISTWKYNLDSNSNTTFEPNTTLSGLNEGVHSIEVWGKDQAGNWNMTSRNFEADTVPPSFSGKNETPSDPVKYRDRGYQFNITVSDSNLDRVRFEFDGANYTPQSFGTEYYVDITSISAGSYNYRWYANDTVGNTNKTEQFNYQVDKATTNTSLFLNETLGDRQYEYSSAANLSVGLNASATVEIWDNLSGSLQQRNSGMPLLQEILSLDYSLGTYLVKGVFFGNQNYTANNETHYLTIIDTVPPTSSLVSDDMTGRVYKGEQIHLRTLWSDNYELDSATLSVNSSGSFQNVSEKTVSDWANFSYTVPTDRFPGTLGWKQFSNDTSSNYQVTSVQTQQVWGYSKTETSLNTTSVQTDETVGASCRVKDANSSSSVSNYNVEVYNGTVLLDQGTTGSQGWFNTSFSLPESQDNVPVKCAIHEDTSKQFTPSSNSSVDLTVNQGNPPVLKDDIYGSNNTELTIGDSLKVYARWNDSLDYAFVEYDDQEKDNYSREYKKSPFTDGWTNFTLNTAQNWFKGTHTFRIYANDSNGNSNNTLQRLEFNVTGFSNVNYIGPQQEADRGIVKLKGEVLDANTSETVSDYNVTFWNNGTKLGTNQTNSSGVAVYNWDASSLDVGEKQVKVTINHSDYFTAADNNSENIFNLTGFLNPEINQPNGILHRGASETFSGEVFNDQGETVLLDSGEWKDSKDNLLVNGKFGTWSVPGSYELGLETITFNVSKQLHQYNSTSTEVEIYGYSQISSNSFTDSKINEGQSSSYECRVKAENTGNPISNYPVEFYNGTSQIGANYTNSTGWASFTFTDTTPGNETYECQISDNATLKFNTSTLASATSEIETVDTTNPEFTVDNPPESFSAQKKQVQWFNTTWSDNFNLSTAVFSFNDSGTFKNTTIDITGTADEADYGFKNTSFNGVLGYRIYGNDTYNNFNSTSTRTATIYGGSDLYSINKSSGTVSPGSTVNITCGVRDNVTNEGLASYQVEFYNGSTLENTASTNSTGQVKFSYSQSFAGDVDLNCRISDALSQHYKADNAKLSETISFEYGTQDSALSGVNSQGGILQGTKTQLESSDGNVLEWLNVENATQPRNKFLEINSTTDIPPGTIQSMELQWNLSRSVENYANAVNDPGGTGTLTLTNGDVNATWFTDPEYAELTEGKSGNSQIFSRKGFYYYAPESISETTVSKIRFEAELISINNGGESVSVDFFDYTNSNYVSCLDYAGTSWSNQSCEITNSATISNIVSGDEISVEFTDGFDQAKESQSSWRVRNAKVEVFYQNPTTGNTFEYELGAENKSSRNLQRIGSADLNGTMGESKVISQEPRAFVAPDGSIKSYLSFNTTNNAFTGSYRRHNFRIDQYNTQINYDVAKSKNLEVETKNSSGAGIEGVRYEVYDSGQLIDDFDSQGENFTDRFEEGRTYDLKHSIPDGSGDFNVTYRNFSLSESFNMRTRLVNYSDLSSTSFVENVSKIYAVDETGFNFDNATIKVPKGSTTPDVILHCKDYDFSNNDCGDWEVNKTSEYATGETANYFEFNVTGFDAFGTGNGKALPNVTDIRIYDVTGLSPSVKETGGTLEASGLNTTFQVDQTDTRREYRFEFKIRNDGSQDWVLQSGDELFHEGLNSSWSVGKKWYNISGTQYTGGTFSNGRVDWSTSGGTLDKQDQNDDMYASYLVNISTTESSLYSGHFLVNDTSDNTGSEDYHELNIAKYGFLDVFVEKPPDGTTLLSNQTFTFNSSITCREGLCGDTNISVRYNTSGTADTLIPENSGKPFHTTQRKNTQECGNGLSGGETCYVNWSINTTGKLKSKHLVDANASSDITEVSANDSKDNEIVINEATLIDIKWDSLDFGLVDPGKLNHSAQGNDGQIYNITVDENSVKIDNLWVRSTNLTAPGWGEYYIPVENISYALQKDITQENQLSREYQVMASDISSGTNVTSYYWLDIPEGIKSAKYNSTIYFKANATK